MPREPNTIYKADLDRMLKAAQADPSYSRRMSDAKQRGLLAVAARGQVKFCFRYRPPGGGHRVLETIDTYPSIPLEAARRIAQDRRVQVAGGADPRELRAEKKRRAMTVREAVEAYLKDYAERVQDGLPAPGGKRKTPAKPSSLASARRRLRSVVARLGDRPVLELSGAEVQKVHRAKRKAPVEANRQLAALAALFGWLQKTKAVPPGTNPTADVEAFTETGERRALTPGELERLGEAMRKAEAAGTAHPVALRLLRFLVLTGWRVGECIGAGRKADRNGRGGLRWGDLDLDRGLAFLADSKAGKQTRTIGAAAVELLRAARPADADPDACVFPGDMAPDKPFVGLTKPRVSLYKAAKIVATPEGRVDTHALRHTFASIGASVQHGRYAGDLGPLLGHTRSQVKGITARYIHDAPGDLQTAADAISEHIARLLGLGKAGAVVAFPGAEAR